MSLFGLSKTMERELTEKEKDWVKDFIKLNPYFSVKYYVEVSEEKFKMPVTETCIHNIMIEMLIPGL